MIIYQNVTDLPTGSILLERGGSSVIIYLENDLHTHICILVWVDVETGEFKKRYEKYRTKPFILDMYVDKNNGSSVVGTHCPVNLSQLEIGDSVNETIAFKPREEILEHPRYMEVITKHVKIFQALYLRNVCYRMFLCKYFPSLANAYVRSLDDPLEVFEKLKNSSNLLKDATDMNVRTAQSCIDIVCLFIRLTYRELSGGEEILDKLPPNVLINDLIEHIPDFYKVYEKESTEVIRTDKVTFLYNFAFLWVFLIFIVLFISIVWVAPFLINKLFTPPRPHLRPRPHPRRSNQNRSRIF